MKRPEQQAQSIPVQAPALAPGTLLARRYFIQGYIGGGGFGHIYMAQDKVLGHRRAIKEAFYRDAYTQQQFRLEAEFVLNARHQHLVRGYAVFEQAGRFYLVMDYVDGQTLEEIAIQHIRHTGHPLPEAQVLDWVMPICDAAQALHQQPTPIIHRDIKPANIKLTRQGMPILIDLGLAKLYSVGTQTISAALAFTPGYAPPEQYQASGATDQRTDVYALGATLFYLLTGYQPTEAPARLSQRALPPPRTLNHALSPQTEAAVLKAMALDPAARQQSAAELLADLRAAHTALETQTLLVNAQAPEPLDDERLFPCMRCGTANPLEARFCMRCGWSISQSLARREKETSGERVVPGAQQETMTPAAQLTGDPGTSQYSTPVPRMLLQSSPQDQKPIAPVERAPHAHVIPASPASPAHPIAPARAPNVVGAGINDMFAGAAQLALHGWPPTPQWRQDMANAREAAAVIAATLALVCLSFSLLALFNHWMLLALIPALALGYWTLSSQHTDMPTEFRRVATWTLIISSAWLILWLCVFFLHHL